MNSFYIKYRPTKFSEIIGQELPKKILINSILKDRIFHSYIFFGIHGVGKTTIARIFAKSINCTNKKNDFEPCNQCTSCLKINNNTSQNVVEIDAASNNGVDEIRAIIDDANYVVEGYKIYIIDEIQMLSKSSFNALLKTLEEPPKNVIFLFATTEILKIPETIISRSMVINLENIKKNDIENYLIKILDNEKIKYDSEAITWISKICFGSLRESVSLLQTIFSYNDSINLEDTFKVLSIIPQNKLESICKNKEMFFKYFFEENYDVKKNIILLMDFLINKNTFTTIENKVDEYFFDEKEVLQQMYELLLYTKENVLLQLGIKIIFLSKNKNDEKDKNIILEEKPSFIKENNKVLEEVNEKMNNQQNQQLKTIKNNVDNSISTSTSKNPILSNAQILKDITNKISPALELIKAKKIQEFMSSKNNHSKETNLIENEQNKNNKNEEFVKEAINRNLQMEKSNIENPNPNKRKNNWLQNLKEKHESQKLQTKKDDNFSLNHTKSITNFLVASNYYLVMKENNDNFKNRILQKWKFIKDFAKTENEKRIISIIEEGTIKYVSNYGTIINFQEKIYFDEFKKISLVKELIDLGEKIFENFLPLLPTHNLSLEKLTNMFNDLVKKNIDIPYQKITYDDLLKNKIEQHNTTKDFAKSIFGEKLKND